MDNKDFENQNEFTTKSSKNFWKVFGTVTLCVFLAVLTVIVINL